MKIKLYFVLPDGTNATLVIEGCDYEEIQELTDINMKAKNGIVIGTEMLE